MTIRASSGDAFAAAWQAGMAVSASIFSLTTPTTSAGRGLSVGAAAARSQAATSSESDCARAIAGQPHPIANNIAIAANLAAYGFIVVMARNLSDRKLAFEIAGRGSNGIESPRSRDPRLSRALNPAPKQLCEGPHKPAFFLSQDIRQCGYAFSARAPSA